MDFNDSFHGFSMEIPSTWLFNLEVSKAADSGALGQALRSCEQAEGAKNDEKTMKTIEKR